ncbi:hypothetical protein HNR23_001864 [Nocardiopsis mwathae]|uniref:Uncharacterized protein n=1 Tax=Nocardiopsis mwathae TaxID=1472723 RepID=A0A7W9YGN0_9ACTN|nr:hypothetical protein [Nocardiopsis mwathae]MBB6171804.1 hypothetical protein [Nocardiopsis mwathae]
MSATEELLAALDDGRLTDAHAYLALKPLWREGRLERPAGRSRQCILRAKEELRAAVCSGLLSDGEAYEAMRPLRSSRHGDPGEAGEIDVSEPGA